MRSRTSVPVALALATAGILGVACDERSPTSAPDFAARGGGGTVTVQFHDVVSLFSSIPGDYRSAAQTVKGTNSTSRIVVNDVPFDLTLAFTAADLATCRPAPGSRLQADDDRLDRLQALPQPLHGALAISVRKSNPLGVAVNFTYVDASGAVLGNPGDSFFLTTGGGSIMLQEEPAQSRLARTAGYVRINRNGDPKDAVKCDGVDYEFTVTK